MFGERLRVSLRNRRVRTHHSSAVEWFASRAEPHRPEQDMKDCEYLQELLRHVDECQQTEAPTVNG
eukprot:387955-Karenia_brevis.AAC.1